MIADQGPEGPLTVCISRAARPGCEVAFERALHDFVQRSLSLPGQLGVHIMRPAPGTGSREYGIIRKFADRASCKAFYESKAFQDYSREVLDLSEGAVRSEEFTGLESWITLPGEALQPLPRWKMAFATLAGVYPTSLLLSETIGKWTGAWPRPLRAMAFSLCMVSLLTWVVMPIVKRVLARWLRPQAKGISHETKP